MTFRVLPSRRLGWRALRNFDLAGGVSPLRVMFLLERLQMGGAERNTVDLILALSRLGIAAELCVLARLPQSDVERRLNDSGIPIHALSIDRYLDLRAAPRLIRLIRERSIDLLHLEDPAGSIAGLAVRHLLNVPVIFTQHVVLGRQSYWRDRWREKLAVACARIASDRAILVAEALRQNFAQYARFAPHRVKMVHNGIDPVDEPHARRTALRDALGWGNKEIVVLMVGVLRPGKGHDIALAAMPQIVRHSPNIILRVAGDGPLRAQLSSEGAKLGQVIEFLGERSDILDLMAASDLLILPSLSEALPTVLLEASMCALPAVATSVGGTVEILRHGQTGLLIPPGNAEALATAVIRLSKDPVARRDMGAAARKLALEEFTLERQARDTLRIYDDLRSRIRRVRGAGHLPEEMRRWS